MLIARWLEPAEAARTAEGPLHALRAAVVVFTIECYRRRGKPQEQQGDTDVGCEKQPPHKGHLKALQIFAGD